MVLFPNAKINIGLDILSRRPDGYHNISTIMVPVQWTDIIEITPAAGSEDSLEVTGRVVDCPPEKNLVIKAVKALRRVCSFPGVELRLHKVIPDGAGLGGGSADAAFTIKGINEMFSLGLDDERMAAVAGMLGADCAFFIYNRPMLCEGIGNILTPVDLNVPSGLHLVIVKPSVSVSTSQAYSKVVPHEPATPVHAIIKSVPVDRWQGRLKNDFEISVFPQFPEIEAVKQWLLDSGAIYASMTGSGASVFGLFAEPVEMGNVKAAFPDAEVFTQYF